MKTHFWNPINRLLIESLTGRCPLSPLKVILSDLFFISGECQLPVLTMSFLSVLQQGSAHADDAASLNSHGGLQSAGSTSSTDLNLQVETFRGPTLPAALYTNLMAHTAWYVPVYGWCHTSIFNLRSCCRPGWPGGLRPGAEVGEAWQGWHEWFPLQRWQVRWWKRQKRYEDTSDRNTHKVTRCWYTIYRQNIW